MSGHTPGPWHVRTLDDSIGGIDAAGDLPVAQAMQVRPLPEDVRQTERRANARLIAAAPELLVSAQELLGCMSLAGWEGDPLAEKARAAIAKATGGQP